MPISGDEYKKIGRAAAGAVSVVAAYDRRHNEPVALTVSSFVTLSFEPPLVMFAIQHNADSYPSMVSSKAFGVSLLSENQSETARRFALKGRDKTAQTTFDSGVILQVPLIPNSLAQIECLTNQIVLSGDHAIVIGMVETVRIFEGEPLLYFARQYGGFRPLSN
jgi:flavin reductase (DIM6/NTAB) family NADH-FMN oxidoreductase RutF